MVYIFSRGAFWNSVSTGDSFTSSSNDRHVGLLLTLEAMALTATVPSHPFILQELHFFHGKIIHVLVKLQTTSDGGENFPPNVS
jgi:hypothetical protein